MRIVVNDIAAQKGGALTVLKDFYNYVKENDTENEWIFLLGEKLLEETDNIKIITLPKIKNSRIKKIIFDFFTGKKFIKKLKADIIFSLQNTAIMGLKIPQIVYIHQSIPFQKIKKFSFIKKKERSLAVYQHLIGRIIKRSAKVCDKVIVQTDWMKKAVCEQCKLSEEKVLKVLPVVPDLTSYETSKTFNKNCFFYPTAPAIYKNNNLIFEACKLLEEKKLKPEVVLTLPKKYSKDNVRCVGRLPYDEVISKYAESTLIFPSYIETFGFPMAEARKVGTVVLASDCPFSREVLENYDNAYFFNPVNAKELANLMEQVMLGQIEKKSIAYQETEGINGWEIILREIINF